MKRPSLKTKSNNINHGFVARFEKRSSVGLATISNMLATCSFISFQRYLYPKAYIHKGVIPNCQTVKNDQKLRIDSQNHCVVEIASEPSSYVVKSKLARLGLNEILNQHKRLRSISEVSQSFSFSKFTTRYTCGKAKDIVIVYPLLFGSAWIVIWVFWGDDSYPGGSAFGVWLLQIVAHLLGYCAQLVGLPPCLGMLIAGLILKNVPGINFGDDIHFELLCSLRRLAVVIMLIRSALSVDPHVINRFRNVIFKLAICSCLVEALVAGLAAHFIMQLPWGWSFVLGCNFSYMCGVVVMPLLTRLENNGCGSLSNAILIAKTVCGLDAVIGITFSIIALGFGLSDDVVKGFQMGLMEVGIGALFGVVWGAVTGFSIDETYRPITRTAVVLIGGIVGFLGMTNIGYHRGAGLACFLGTTVTTSIWRRQGIHGHAMNNDHLCKHFTDMWYFSQPLLFGIIGIYCDLSLVKWSFVFQALICLLLSEVVRLLVALLASRTTDLTIREILFIALTWIPKATVQASRGPQAWEFIVHTKFATDKTDMTFQVMASCAIVILIASSVGPLLIATLGPVLLPKDDTNTHCDGPQTQSKV